jgi:hypothetical protein
MPPATPSVTPPTNTAAPPAGAAPAQPGAAADAAKPLADATARFEPARFEATVNGAFSTALVLDGGADIVSAQPLQIKFDPKLLRLTDVSAGDLFSKDGAAPVFARDIQNDQGLATVQIGRQPGATGVAAPGTLLTLKFQALAPGTATVSVLNVTLRNSQARAVGSSSPQLAVTIK